MSSSSNEPGSSSFSIRSRAVSLPLACCFSTASSEAEWIACLAQLAQVGELLLVGLRVASRARGAGFYGATAAGRSRPPAGWRRRRCRCRRPDDHRLGGVVEPHSARSNSSASRPAAPVQMPWRADQLLAGVAARRRLVGVVGAVFGGSAVDQRRRRVLARSDDLVAELAGADRARTELAPLPTESSARSAVVSELSLNSVDSLTSHTREGRRRRCRCRRSNRQGSRRRAGSVEGDVDRA